MKRRSFFKAIARAVAIVAIAPELCFRTKLPLPVVYIHRTKWTAMNDEIWNKWVALVLKNNPLYSNEAASLPVLDGEYRLRDWDDVA